MDHFLLDRFLQYCQARTGNTRALGRLLPLGSVGVLLVTNHYVTCCWFATALFNYDDEKTWIITWLGPERTRVLQRISFLSFHVVRTSSMIG